MRPMSEKVAAFPAPGHDHRQCVATLLAAAERLCNARKARLTEGRRRVLEIVAASHSAIGAYDIIDRLAERGRRAAPVTVYRALDFLIDQGLVHRLASVNAYVACARPSDDHGAQFLICKRCRAVAEISSAAVDHAIVDGAGAAGFDISAPVVEVAGLCLNCRRGTGDGR
jgi:Fur family zinc uptake transcriptional regulator